MPTPTSGATPPIRPRPLRAYELVVTLRGVAPSVWRRVVVPADVTLWELHRVLQHIFGWTQSHLFGFEVAGKRYLDPWFDDPKKDDAFATDVTLAEVGGDHSPIVYTYDLGDEWKHDVQIVRGIPLDELLPFPVCTGGSGVVPDENCGGARAWMAAFATRHTPSSNERASIDVVAVNEMLPAVIAPRPQLRRARFESQPRRV